MKLTREQWEQRLNGEFNKALNASSWSECKRRVVNDLADAVKECIADMAIQSASHPTWVSAPLEPTKEMVVAGDDALQDCVDSDYSSDADGNRYDYTTIRSDAPARVYKAMLSALPPSPVSTEKK